VVRRDSGIETISDLVGKRIALPPKGSGELESFWLRWPHLRRGA
jgi:ABC-type nitrate/sulfonate/bicarbonate transport system substrate-binding protein